ncbi:hypothetical protein NB694_004607 [Pantoea ananatis]|nr:hypothetical protein [Pantoea ananatis]
MEYLLLHGGSRGHLLRYELLWDGGDGEENHLCGLLNVDETAKNNEGDKRKFGSEECKSALSSGQVRAKFGQEKPVSDQTAEGLQAGVVRVDENAVIRAKKKTVLPPLPSL